MALPERVFAGGVQEVVRRRLNRVPMRARPLLRLAAVAGRELDLDVLWSLAPKVDLNAWLHTCADVAVLEAEGERWRFTHHKLRQGALDALPEAARPRLHRQVAETIETVYPDAPEQVATLAHLWGVAGEMDKERHYARLAGEQAVRHSANIEAIGHFERALALLETLPHTPERAEQELTLQIDLGVPVILTKGHAAPEVERVYSRARELCRQVGETPQLFPALYGLCTFYVMRGKLQTARELAEQIMHLAQTAQDPALLLEAHRRLGATFYHLGELASARRHTEQAIALYDPRQHRSHAFLYGHGPAVSCLSYAAFALWLLGYPDQALKRTHELLTLAQELSHPFSLGYALAIAGTQLHQFRGEVQTVREWAEAAIALSTEHGFPLWLGMGTVMRGWALAEQGQVEEGIAQMHEGLVTLQATGAKMLRLYSLLSLAETYGKVGQAAEGLHLVAEALAAVDETGQRCWWPDLYRLKGELLLMQGEAETIVEACFQRAIEIARRQSAKSLELRAAASLSRVWQKQGKRKEARELLAGIYDWLTEGFGMADLKEAKALLDEL